MTTLVLFSGGLDSTVALYDAIAKGESVYGLTFDYGQSHARELLAARKIWSLAHLEFGGKQIREHMTIRFPAHMLPRGTSTLLGGGPIKEYDSIPKEEESATDPAFVPHRNLIFLSIAGAWARHWKCNHIRAGLRGGFPDCTRRFEMYVGDILQMSDPPWEIDVWSPTHISRAQTVLLAQELPGCWDALAYSMTCFNGTEPPCGRCLPCLKRAEGFAEWGLEDPLIARLKQGAMGKVGAIGRVPT